MKSFLKQRIAILIALFSLVSCKGIISDHQLDIQNNQIISTTIFTEKFGLPFSGNFPIIIKDVDYGEINLLPKTVEDEFSINIAADLSSFTGDVWDGFGPISRLPNGESFPSWLGTDNLISISIPTLTELFSFDLLVQSKNDRIFIGLNLNIQAVDQHYPEGLNISQEIQNRNSNYPYAAIYLYGPKYNENGDKIKNSGLIILSSFQIK